MDNRIYRKQYDIENFSDYDNFYTIMECSMEIVIRRYFKTDFEIIKNIIENNEELVIYKTLRRGKRGHPIVICVTKKYKPIYGHWSTKDNLFIYCDVEYSRNRKSIIKNYKYKRPYRKTSLDKLLKANNLAQFNYYRFYNTKDLDYILDIINEEEKKKRIYIDVPDDYYDIMNKSFYEYKNEQLDELLAEELEQEIGFNINVFDKDSETLHINNIKIIDIE